MFSDKLMIKKVVMKKMNFLPATIKSLLLTLFCIASLGVQAQLLDPADNNDPSGIDQNENRQNQVESGPDPGDDPGNVPVDGGLGFLLAAGVGYGANKLRKYRKEKRTFGQ
ncbi:MAG: hypothetical protein RL750_230 [Bacteroidota bacterium]|jgi:hypothetical protein